MTKHKRSSKNTRYYTRKRRNSQRFKRKRSKTGKYRMMGGDVVSIQNKLVQFNQALTELKNQLSISNKRFIPQQDYTKLALYIHPDKNRSNDETLNGRISDAFKKLGSINGSVDQKTIYNTHEPLVTIDKNKNIITITGSTNKTTPSTQPPVGSNIRPPFAANRENLFPNRRTPSRTPRRPPKNENDSSANRETFFPYRRRTYMEPKNENDSYPKENVSNPYSHQPPSNKFSTAPNKPEDPSMKEDPQLISLLTNSELTQYNAEFVETLKTFRLQFRTITKKVFEENISTNDRDIILETIKFLHTLHAEAPPFYEHSSYETTSRCPTIDLCIKAFVLHAWFNRTNETVRYEHDNTKEDLDACYLTMMEILTNATKIVKGGRGRTPRKTSRKKHTRRSKCNKRRNNTRRTKAIRRPRV